MKFVFDARIIMDVLTRRMDEVQRIPTNKRRARYDRKLGGCSSLPVVILINNLTVANLVMAAPMMEVIQMMTQTGIRNILNPSP